MKAGTAQKMMLNMLSTSVMIKLGKVYGNLMVDVQTTNEKLVMRAQNLVMQITGVNAETAASLLEQAHGHVKTAVVMHKRGVDADQARALLAAANGRLREVIG
jgi:N-acetylmuramic acid 6-phosphate etherase